MRNIRLFIASVYGGPWWRAKSQYIRTSLAYWKILVASDQDGKGVGFVLSSMGINSFKSVQRSSYPFADLGLLARDSRAVAIVILV